MDYLILSWQQGHTEVWKFPYTDILCVHVYAYGGGWLGAVPKCREQRMLDVNTVDVLLLTKPLGTWDGFIVLF